MKFNSTAALLVCAISCSLLFSCSATPNKVSYRSAPDKSPPESRDAKAPAGLAAAALPPGPPTANPYLQTKASVSAASEASFREAVAAIEQKNWSQAERLLQSLAASNPQLSGIPLNLGIVYRARGDNARAAQAFAEAIKANSKNLDAYNQLAVLKREAGNFSEAEALYRQALAVWPFHPESQKNIAILYELYMGKPERALPHYLAYQQLLPAPDKQLDSWIADLQRRLSAGKKAPDQNDSTAGEQ